MRQFLVRQVAPAHSQNQSLEENKNVFINAKAFRSFSVTAGSMLIYLAVAKMSHLIFFPAIKRLFKVDWQQLLSGFMGRNAGYDL